MFLELWHPFFQAATAVSEELWMDAPSNLLKPATNQRSKVGRHQCWRIKTFVRPGPGPWWVQLLAATTMQWRQSTESHISSRLMGGDFQLGSL